VELVEMRIENRLLFRWGAGQIGPHTKKRTRGGKVRCEYRRSVPRGTCQALRVTIPMSEPADKSLPSFQTSPLMLCEMDVVFHVERPGCWNGFGNVGQL